MECSKGVESLTREHARREWACAGKPSCLKVWIRLLGIAFQGLFVRSCSDRDSWRSAWVVGCTYDAFQEMVGKACWL